MPNSNSSGGQMMMIAAVLVCFCLFISSVATGVLFYNQSKSSSSSSKPKSTPSGTPPSGTPPSGTPPSGTSSTPVFSPNPSVTDTETGEILSCGELQNYVSKQNAEDVCKGLGARPVFIMNPINISKSRFQCCK